MKPFSLEMLSTLVLVGVFLANLAGSTKVFSSGVVDLYFEESTNGYGFELRRDNVVKMTGVFGKGIDFSNTTPNFNVTIMSVDNGFRVDWRSSDLSFQATDCIDLQSETLHWYGGPQIYDQKWPIEKLQLSGDDAYVVRKNDNFAVPERYWLNSIGASIFISERSPLFVDQNSEENPDRVCFTVKNEGPYINRTGLFHQYYLTAFDEPVSAHRFAVAQFLGEPAEIPNVKMINEPIWTTWAKYKKYIDDSIVSQFAYDILEHGFKGQIEIDEQWETCFGSREFIPDKFGNIRNVVADLQDQGFRVTLWAAPFINPECTDLIIEGEEKGYYVQNTIGNMTTVWWESNFARQIDFTNPEAREWYSEKLRRILEEVGVDGFKFDAGETDYVAQPAVYANEDQELIPNILTQKYINTVSEFSNLAEVRSAFRTQNYSMFLRMIDKDSVWGLDDGLESLVTTLLQLNMVGYSFVLPDMIGGNGYSAQPDLELLIRWTQATVFMPSMQFSYLPWDFEDDEELGGTEIVRSMVELHAKYAPTIIAAMEEKLLSQTPTNPPIWWIAPFDEIALGISDEFLLGENILAAPVMEPGATSRKVYLPEGTWVDGNEEDIKYEGPIWLLYDAPLSVLPYFIKK